MKRSILELIETIPEGYSEGLYAKKKYGISKTVYNEGRSYKIYGEELGGQDFVSLNYYITEEKEWLKPCEMPEQKVLHFLEHVTLLSTN